MIIHITKIICITKSASYSQLDDVRVAEEFKILYFSFNFASYIQILNLLPVEDLHRHPVLRLLVDANCQM